MSYTIYCGNNRDFYDRVPEVQAVITDPPYGAEVHSKDRTARDAEGRVSSVPIPFSLLEYEDIASLATFCGEKCKGWSIVFCQTEESKEWATRMGAYPNVRYWRPMLWIKTNPKPNLSGNGPGIGHETLVSFWCGGGRQRWNGRGKVGIFYSDNGNLRGAVPVGVKHPTNKPVSLMKELVRYFTDPGDTIFDPFMGCGATGVAALELGRKFIGIEKNEEYYAEAERRLQAASRPTLIEAEAKPQTLFGDSAFGSIGTRKRLEREAKEKEKEDAIIAR